MNLLLKTLICSLATILLISGHVLAQDIPAPAVEQGSLGSTKNVHKAGDLFFGGQFTKEDLQEISGAKIARVVTFRTDGEIDWDEEAAVKAAGMEFVKLPFKAPETLTDDVFDQVRALLNDKSKKTLFHCGSANRVAGVWLPYRVLDQGVDLEQALVEAKEIGLKKAFLKDKALAYIKSKQTNAEQSVKPGVNKGYKDPNLDVEKMVERFELESREVYLTRKRIVAACEIEAGSTIADVGAGTGLFSRLFSSSVGEDGWVYAVDIAPRLVAHIVTEASTQNIPNITGVVCAENSIGLPADSVDVVFLCDVYHHFEFPKSTLASIHKALQPGGKLVVVDFERIEGKSREWLMGHVRAGKEVFRAEIQDAGFDFQEEKAIEGFKENYFLVFKKAK